MRAIRIVLADDHALLRAGIRSFLEDIAGFEIVGEASNGTEALAIVKIIQPDILLTDIAMPEHNGLEVARQISKEFPHVRVVILSIHATEEFVCQALQAGAAGYLLKDAEPAELERALRAVAGGETYLMPTVSKHVVTDYLRRVSGEKGPAEMLTPRQREILPLIVAGKSTKEIARLLLISVKTVETHRSQLMDRLDIHDIPTLVRWTIQVGLVRLDDTKPM